MDMSIVNAYLTNTSYNLTLYRCILSLSTLSSQVRLLLSRYPDQLIPRPYGGPRSSTDLLSDIVGEEHLLDLGGDGQGVELRRHRRRLVHRTLAAARAAGADRTSSEDPGRPAETPPAPPVAGRRTMLATPPAVAGTPATGAAQAPSAAASQNLPVMERVSGRVKGRK